MSLVKVPFFGKVIPAHVAQPMNKAQCLPLGDNNGIGPELFVESTSHLNCMNSMFSPAWAVLPLPMPKPVVEKVCVDADAILEAECLEQGIVIKAKKKVEKPVEKKNTKEKEHTHVIDFAGIELTFEACGSQYSYNVPCLKDADGELQDLVDTRCWRSRSEWDSGAALPKSKKIKAKKTFAAS